MEWNRAFMTREPGCARNGVPQGRFFAPIHAANDDKHNHIHRAQAVRARWHPCFVLPSDPPLPYLTSNDHSSWHRWNENEPFWTATSQGALVKCESGIGAIEIEVGDKYKTHVEWLNLPSPRGPPQMPPKETMLAPSYLSGLVGFDMQHPSSPHVRITALACNMRQAFLDGFREHGVAVPLHLPGIDPSRRSVFRTLSLGQTNHTGDKLDLVFSHTHDNARVTLVAIDIFSGAALDGLQFHYSNNTVSKFGPCGGSPFRINVNRDDKIQRLNVRCGQWIDAIEIVFTSGRSSGMRGTRRVDRCACWNPQTAVVRSWGCTGRVGPGWIRLARIPLCLRNGDYDFFSEM